MNVDILWALYLGTKEIKINDPIVAFNIRLDNDFLLLIFDNTEANWYYTENDTWIRIRETCPKL